MVPTNVSSPLALRPRYAAKALGISPPNPLGTDGPTRPDSLSSHRPRQAANRTVSRGRPGSVAEPHPRKRQRRKRGPAPSVRNVETAEIPPDDASGQLRPLTLVQTLCSRIQFND